MKGLRTTAVLEWLKRLTFRGAGPATHSTRTAHRSDSRGHRVRPSVEALEGRQLLSADLTGMFATVPPSLPVGAPDAVVVRVTNSGNARARGPVTVQLYASADTTLDSGDVALGSLTRRLNLRAGRSASVPVQFNVPAALSGSDYLLARIDGSQAGAAVSTVASPAALPVQAAFVDLAGQITRLPARPVQFGRHSRLSQMTVEVVNQGNTVARGRVSVTVYLSTSGKPDATAVPLNVSLPRNVKLRPGQKVKLKVPFTAPAGTAPGLYYLLAQVNVPSALADRDASNNLAASATQVEVIPAPGRTRLGYGYLIGATFYPYDGGYGFPFFGAYSEDYEPPTGYVPVPDESGQVPYEPPYQPPYEPPGGGGGVDTSSSSAGADFGGGGADVGGGSDFSGGGSDFGGGGGGSDSGGDSGGGDSGGGDSGGDDF